MLMACSSLLTVGSSLRLNLAIWVELWLETFVPDLVYKVLAVTSVTHISYFLSSDRRVDFFAARNDNCSHPGY
jgi:hypothetical protein